MSITIQRSLGVRARATAPREEDRRGLRRLMERLGVRPWQMRSSFVVPCLLPGPQFVLYLALWIPLPSE